MKTLQTGQGDVIRGQRMNEIAAKICLIIGLSVRVFASVVSAFPVHSHRVPHYLFAGLSFLSIGCYMLIEICAVDVSYEKFLINDEYEMIFRGIICGIYWIAFICTVVFMKLQLWAFSSIGELTALLCSELYILTYLSSFRVLDNTAPYLQFHS